MTRRLRELSYERSGDRKVSEDQTGVFIALSKKIGSMTWMLKCLQTQGSINKSLSHSCINLNKQIA